jgi:phosphoribosylanthranilate isomerase
VYWCTAEEAVQNDSSMTKLFRTKVCGIKTTDDLCDAIKVGVDAIGLNFVPESPRFIAPKLAAELSAAAANNDLARKEGVGQIALTGIFVNPTPDFVRQILRIVPLQFVQLHGEEQADDWRNFDDAPLIKAIRWSGESHQAGYLTRWHQLLGSRLVAFLVDAPSTDVRGGSGLKADWNSLVPRPSVIAGKPLILAGGLTPDNVAQAIATVQPVAVDTASGVESAPGKKDAVKMQRYVQNAHEAWHRLKK